MKKILLICVLIMVTALAYSQSPKRKLTKEESSKMTQDQRYVYESGRKSKKDGRTSLKQKARIQKKESNRSERMRPPKRKKRTVKG